MMHPYNPLDWTRLLYWIFVRPECVFAYPDKKRLRDTGVWLAHAFIMLPLWVLTGAALFDQAFKAQADKFVQVSVWWLLLPPLLAIVNIRVIHWGIGLLTFITLPVLLILPLVSISISFPVFLLTFITYLILASAGVIISGLIADKETWLMWGVSRLLYWGTLRRAGDFFALFEAVLLQTDKNHAGNSDSRVFFGVIVASAAMFTGLYLFGGWRLLGSAVILR
jgi:hypothetical protein